MSIVRVPFSLTGGGAAAYVPAGAIYLDGSTQYLTQTFSSSGDRDDYTRSVWIKRSSLGSDMQIFDTGPDGGNNLERLSFNSDNSISWVVNDSNVTQYNYKTSAVFRDPTAWMHIVCSRTGTTLTLYINGIVVTAFATSTNNGTTNNGRWTYTDQNLIGRYYLSASEYFNGYLAEIIQIDGTALGADSFGEFDTNGNWVPIDPSGLTFGTNGFWLDFADSADLGNDVSGNGNDWTLNSVTSANATSDRPADDATADPVVGNYCTWNPLAMNSSPTVSEGNLKIAGNSATNYRAVPTIIPSSGKWHYEWQWQGPTIAAGTFIGVEASRTTNYIASVSQPGATSTSWGASTENSTTLRVYHNSSYNDRTIPFTFVQNDYIVCDFDVDAGDIWLGVHDVSGGTTYWVNGSGTFTSTFPSGSPTYSGVTMADGVLFPAVGTYTSTYYGKANFGQNTFVSSQPTDFKALNTANLPAPTVTDPSAYFQSLLYTGTGAELAVTGFTDGAGNNITPDFVWVKDRDFNTNHQLVDAVRGATYELNPNLGNTESTVAQGVKSFDSGGFTLGTDAGYNDPGTTYVAWCLKAGGAGSSNTDGSTTSTVSVAAHGGFSIGTYPGTGSAATVGHGLSRAPEWVIVKMTAGTGTQNWTVFQKNIFDGASNAYIILNLPDASTSGASFSSTAPTASVFSVGNDATNQSSSTFVFYAFAKTPGFIASGKYTGNGSTDGPYVVVDDGGSGFRPAFVLIKNSSNATGYDWQIVDATRDPYNPANKNLSPNLITAEGSGLNIDFTANGFKPRVSSNSVNASGNTYIYLAFAEYPFGGDGVAQAKAR